LSDIGHLWRDFDVVGIDEGQFFPDLESFCETAANAGKVIVVAALDGTFQRKVSAGGGTRWLVLPASPPAPLLLLVHTTAQ
jgi:hypothetical protein